MGRHVETAQVQCLLSLTFLILKGCSQVKKSESVSCSVMPDSLPLHGLYSPPGFSVHGILQARVPT